MLTPAELLDMMRPNNLAILSVLADSGNGEAKDADTDLAVISGGDHPASTPQRILHWDSEWHYDPKGYAVERKVIGGHLILLGLKHGGKPWAEYTYPMIEWAREQGAIAGFAHMQYLAQDGVPNDLTCCHPLEYPVETALGASSFLMEDVGGSEAAVKAYYRLLNCGFRPGLAAGTDYPCNSSEPLGTLLTYVNVKAETLNYRDWIAGIAQGRTVISRNAHQEFLELTVNGTASPGDDVPLDAAGTVSVRARWTSMDKLSGRIELVQNGQVVAKLDGSAAPGRPLVLESKLAFTQSGWVCARRMGAKGHATHTAAVFVTVAHAPVRASSADAEFFVRWCDNLIRKTSPGGPWNKYFSHDLAAAQQRYVDAREVFRTVAMQARAQGR